jgi:hypothetical protein
LLFENSTATQPDAQAVADGPLSADSDGLVLDLKVHLPYNAAQPRDDLARSRDADLPA